MKAIAICLLLCLACTAAWGGFKLPFEVPPDTSRPPITPSWGFGLWVWEDDLNTAAAVQDLVEGYARHNIPISAVMIDSPWSTLYNNFRWDTRRYPEPQKLIDGWHARGLKVVLWMTNMVNSKDQQADACGDPTEDIYTFAKEKGYLCNNGKLTEWWKGAGGFPDYTNPEAVSWWHSLMDRALDMGIDGWKVDGSSAHFPLTGGTCMAGPINMMQYSDMYYRDTYQHLVYKRKHGVTMVRSVDTADIGYEGRHSPRDAAPVTWVGDNRHTWDERGILEALDCTFRAMDMGYPVIGSDTAGYQSDPANKTALGVPRTLFVRWAQWNAFMPFFINGGHNEHRPWMFDQEVLDIFRDYAWTHEQLKPYWYSGVVQAHNGTAQFLARAEGKWEYTIGKEFLVAPIYEDSTRRQVVLPEGRWHYYCDPAQTWTGPTTITLDVPLNRFPVFVREGAIIPMRQVFPGVDAAWAAGALTLDLYPGADGQYTVYEEPTLAETRVTLTGSEADCTVTITGGPQRPYVLRVAASKAPRSVSAGGKSLAQIPNQKAWLKARTGWRYADGRLWIKLPTLAKTTVRIKG